MHIFHSHDELRACLGQEVAVTGWRTITQEQIKLFADATKDHQWIHLDPVRAAQGPFGVPVAHGFLSLSLLSWFYSQAVRIEGQTMAVNYGLNKVRFPSPVPVNSRIRARVKVQSVEVLAPDCVQIGWHFTIEREGCDKPVCVAEWLVRSYSTPVA